VTTDERPSNKILGAYHLKRSPYLAIYLRLHIMNSIYILTSKAEKRISVLNADTLSIMMLKNLSYDRNECKMFAKNSLQKKYCHIIRCWPNKL